MPRCVFSRRNVILLFTVFLVCVVSSYLYYLMSFNRHPGFTSVFLASSILMPLTYPVSLAQLLGVTNLGNGFRLFVLFAYWPLQILVGYLGIKKDSRFWILVLILLFLASLRSIIVADGVLSV